MLNKKESFKEISKYINGIYEDDKERIIIHEIYFNNKTLSSLGNRFQMTREGVRQIKQRWLRRKPILEERARFLLVAFFGEMTFEKRYVKLPEEWTETFFLFRLKIKNIFQVRNGFLIEEKWLKYFEKNQLKYLEEYSYCKEEAWGIYEDLNKYKGFVFKNHLGFANYLLIEKELEVLVLDDWLEYFCKIIKPISLRSLGSKIESKPTILKVSLNTFKKNPENAKLIIADIQRIVDDYPGEIISKEVFFDSMKEINQKYFFIKYEAYFIFKEAFKYSNKYSFSQGNRMVISKERKVLTIDSVLKSKYGNGPSVFTIKYAKEELGFTDTTFINMKNIYNYNEHEYLYFDDIFYQEIRIEMLNVLSLQGENTITYDDFKKLLLENNGKEYLFNIFNSSSLTRITRKALNNIPWIELVGTRGNMLIKTKK